MSASLTSGGRLAKLYERWGRRVVEAHGILFTNVDPGSRVFMPVVDHGAYELSEGQAAAVLRQAGGLILRYPSLTQAGLEGGAYVCTDSAYDFPHLTKRMRNYVRRGQERCEIRPLDGAELTRDGLRLNRETDGRHGRCRPEFCDEARWPETVKAALDCEGVFVQGAVVDGELAAYQVGVVDGEWVYAVIQMSRTDMLEHHPNHALDFAFNRWSFLQPGVSGVSIGPLPLRPNDGLHNYKVRMGFRVERRAVAVRLHSALGWLAGSRLMERGVAWARERTPWRDRLEGLELVIRGSRITAREQRVEFGGMAEPERETT